MRKLLVLTMMVTALTAACQPSPTATPTPIPARAPQVSAVEPSETATAEVATPEPGAGEAATPTATRPSATPTAEPPTATPLPPVATTKIIVNVRAGPGAAYALIGKLAGGVSSPILGKSADSKWWQIAFEGKMGWIAADFTDVRGGTSGVPVVAVAKPPTPTPAPTRVVITRLQPTATPTADIPLSGGRIYFVVKQGDESYTTAWVRPTDREKIFSDVTLGTMPGDLNTTLSTNASPLDFSDRAGKLAYVIGSGTQNKLQTIDANQNVVDVASHGAIATPRWFGSGEQLAYIGYDNSLANQKIYIVNADGTGRRECFGARSGETLRGLDVNPATGEIVFASNYTGSTELWKLDAECRTPERLTQFNADTTAPAFSPDGRQLAFVSNQSGVSDYEIYMMNADGTGLVQMLAGFSPVFSPDGRWLAFSQNGEVYMMDVTGNRIQTIAPGYRPAWAKE